MEEKEFVLLTMIVDQDFAVLITVQHVYQLIMAKAFVTEIFNGIPLMSRGHLI